MPLESLLRRLESPAIASSFLAQLPDTAREALIGTSTTLTVGHRRVIFSSNESPRAGFILSGLARTYLSAQSGRQLTVRYPQAGDIIGNVAGTSAKRAPLSVAAVTDCVVVEISIPTLFELVSSDARVGAALVAEITARLQDSYAALVANTLGTMRERVAWHLLDQAIVSPGNGLLVVSLTQQQVADSVGTAREVVARVLHDLRDDGIVGTAHHRIEIVDPLRMASLAGRQSAAGDAEPA